MKFLNMNENAVSPIVATLVLIVVAVVGAIAVGVIMDGLSQDVGNQVDVGKIGGSSGEILIAGSTTVQPASELLAKAFMAEHKGVKITVQGGGSGVGVTSVGMNIVNIGSASRSVNDGELAKYPDLQTHQIGGSAVVVISNNDTPAQAVKNITVSQLKEAYDLADANGKVDLTVDADGTVTAVTAGTTYTLFQRSESSGTEETFGEWLGGDYKTAKNVDSSKALGKTGNGGVLDAVKSTKNSIGFVDYGYAVKDGKANGVQIVGMSSVDGTEFTASIAKDGSASTLKTQILNSLKGDAKFPLDTADGGKELTRPLNYITNGAPSSAVKNYIDFCKSPGAMDLFNDAGMFSLIEFS